jgi:hypothetical protein
MGLMPSQSFRLTHRLSAMGQTTKTVNSRQAGASRSAGANDI